MCSHEAGRCLASLVKGSESGREREQKQEERGLLVSVMLLVLGQFFKLAQMKRVNEREQRGKRLMQRVQEKDGRT